MDHNRFLEVEIQPCLTKHMANAMLLQEIYTGDVELLCYCEKISWQEICQIVHTSNFEALRASKTDEGEMIHLPYESPVTRFEYWDAGDWHHKYEEVFSIKERDLFKLILPNGKRVSKVNGQWYMF